MDKKIKFKFQEIDNTGKVLVYIDYIDRNFFKSDFDEEWRYNNIDFNIRVYDNNEEGYLSIIYNDLGRLELFILHIGTVENYFIINKNEIKLFEDLENIVYNVTKEPLSKYIKEGKYYILYLNSVDLKYKVDNFNFYKDSTDKNYFLNGNLFKTKKEVEDIIEKLNKKEITMEEIKKERQDFFKNYIFE